MRALFSMDSKFMIAMSRIGDLIILNLIYILTSVPIFTIGASTTALYSVCFRFNTDREKGLLRGYFSAFKDNFKQATLMWLVILLCGGTACINIFLVGSLPGFIRYTAIIFCILLLIALLVFSYAFPLLSQFDNKNKETLRNALILSLGYLPRSILIVALNILPWALLLLDLFTFLQAGFIWVAIYFSLAAYVNTFLLKKVFAPYIPQEDNEDDTAENKEETT